MIPAPPLSETLLRLAHWFAAARNGTHDFTPESMEAFGLSLHACADQAETLERDLRGAREVALDAAVRRVIAETATAGRAPDLTSGQLTTLVAISRGDVPNVVLLPLRPRRAVDFDSCSGGDAA